jgi:hypothetical protein
MEMSNRHLFNSYNITDEIFKTKIKDFTLGDSRTLLSPYRIDLIAKFLYVESKELGINVNYCKLLYKAHISAFTHGNYIEQGQESSKTNIESFYKVLDDLVLKIDKVGLDQKVSRIPMDKYGVIIDGAHRTAVCAYFNKPIPVTQFNIEGQKYDLEFFRKRMMKSKFLDFLAHSYIKIKNKNVYALCVWPKGHNNKDFVKEFLTKKVHIVFEKQVFLTARGAHSFVSQIYSHHDWVGTPKDGFNGSKNKVNACFSNNKPMVLFVFETDKPLDEIVVLKEEIRNLIGFGKHSVHVTDNQEETLQISELLLNENSVYHMNYANPFKYYKGIERFIAFSKYLKEHNHNSKEILIDGSGSMEVFGLRKADDIDFISKQNIQKGKYHSKRTENDIFKLYGYNVDALQSPDSYFYFFGVRFLTLDEVLISKKKRGEKKDLVDIAIIGKFLKTNRVSRYSDIKFNIKRNWMRRKKNFRSLVGKCLKKIGIFNFIKNLLK